MFEVAAEGLLTAKNGEAPAIDVVALGAKLKPCIVLDSPSDSENLNPEVVAEVEAAEEKPEVVAEEEVVEEKPEVKLKPLGSESLFLSVLKVNPIDFGSSSKRTSKTAALY